jgi:hypothetical protein
MLKSRFLQKKNCICHEKPAFLRIDRLHMAGFQDEKSLSAKSDGFSQQLGILAKMFLVTLCLLFSHSHRQPCWAVAQFLRRRGNFSDMRPLTAFNDLEYD